MYSSNKCIRAIGYISYRCLIAKYEHTPLNFKQLLLLLPDGSNDCGMKTAVSDHRFSPAGA